MYPFEFYDINGNIQFHFERWGQFRRQKFAEYPVNTKLRMETTLIFPRDHRDHIPVHWNPHANIDPNLSPYHCFCEETDWSVIFEPYPAHVRSDELSYKLIIEQGHENPWGEPIYLFSTAGSLLSDHAIRYAYFRGQHWKILSFIFYSPNFWIPLITPITIDLNHLWFAPAGLQQDKLDVPDVDFSEGF